MNRKSRANALYFEELGDDFEKKAHPYDLARRGALIERFLPAAAQSASCLEVGCGFGGISRMLAPRVGKLTVSDISEALARRAGEALSVDYSAQDAVALSFESNTFDLVVSSECIEHTPDPLACIREMVRVVKPGGTVIVTTPNKLWFPVLVVSELLRVRGVSGNEYWIWPGDARRVMLESGCAEVALGGCHLFPWQVPGSAKLLPVFDRFGSELYPFMINFAARGTKKTA